MTFRKLSGVLIAPMTLVLVGCTVKAKNDPRTQPQLVRIIAVAASSESTRSFTGVVTARVQSDLGFRVPGKVTKRLVDVGQVVRTGQPLMRIDITDYAHAITTQACWRIPMEPLWKRWPSLDKLYRRGRLSSNLPILVHGKQPFISLKQYARKLGIRCARPCMEQLQVSRPDYGNSPIPPIP